MAATHSDPVLSRVIKFTRSGWPDTVPDDLKPYWRKKDEIAAEGDCLFWGTCVIVPEKLRGRVLEELHRGHPGIVRMKSLARSHVWWPNLDSQVETQAKSCTACPGQQELTTQSTAPSLGMAHYSVATYPHRLCWTCKGNNAVSRH